MSKSLKFILSLFTMVLVLFIAIGCQPADFLVKAQADNGPTWTAILALLVPLIAVALMQTGWTKQVNSLIALGVTLAVAVLDAWYFNKLNYTDLPGTVLAILVGALTTYKTIWAPLGVIDWWANVTTLNRFKFVSFEGGPERGLPW